jgi:hypothetical protein
MAHPKRKISKPEETSAERTIRQLLLNWPQILLQERRTCTTERTGTKESFTTEDRFLLTIPSLRKASSTCL